MENNVLLNLQPVYTKIKAKPNKAVMYNIENTNMEVMFPGVTGPSSTTAN